MKALSNPRAIIGNGGLTEPKAKKNMKVKFIFDKLVLSQDSKSFVQIIKYKKKHYMQKNDIGETIKIFYKDKYYAFEEDFEFFDYEIVIGQVDAVTSQQMVHFNEERDPVKRTQQLLGQLEVYDGIESPL